MVKLTKLTSRDICKEGINMNKFTVIVAVALVATSAFASKARLGALQASPHLSDTRDVFSKPDQALTHGEFATMELSNNAAGANDTAPNAEGGFVRKMGENGALGAYIGNKANQASKSMNLITTVTPKIQNPLNVYYASKMGEMQWGLGFNYSNGEDKVAKNKSSSMGLNASLTSNAGWDAQLAFGLSGEATQADTTKVEQKSPVTLSGGYWIDSMYLYGQYDMYGAKTKVNSVAGTEIDNNAVSFGVVNSHKKDGADFFYGISYMMMTSKTKDGPKTERTMLPVVVGIEADATSWMVLRASVTQNILIDTTKTTPATGAATVETSNYDDTVTAAGVGFKLGKFMVDGSLAATTAGATSGKFGTDTGFLSNVGLTYQF